MKKILFLIHDLGPGGAEKVLVNLANGLDRTLFEVSVKTLFDWGQNRQFLKNDIHYSSWIPVNVPANSHWMKMWTPQQLWKMIIPDRYDIVVSFLEGPCARVTGGCPENGPKIIDWIHITLPSEEKFREGFRSRDEAIRCYDRADAIIFVSEDVRDVFLSHIEPAGKTAVLYNIYESEKIRALADEEPAKPTISRNELNWCSIGKLISRKGWDRMLRIQQRLKEADIPAKFYIIGDGPLRRELEALTEKTGLSDSVVFTGYQINPYAYLSRCILAVCASQAEGFSTAAVESLLVGTPFCSVKVGGMYELLGKNGEYGVVTENDNEALYQAILRFFTDSDYRKMYQHRAAERGKDFDRDKSIKAVENLLLSL